METELLITKFAQSGAWNKESYKVNLIILPKHYEGLTIDGGPSFDSLNIPGDITPRNYFEYSIADLNDGNDNRHNINALANAKRALHFLIDLLSEAFGINHLSIKHKDFPLKLRFCQDCGLTSPSILRKLNKLRNIIEHEYYIPLRSEVEDYVDIVELFLSSNEKFLKYFPTGDIDWVYSKKTISSLPDIVGCDFPPYEGVIYLSKEGYKMENSIKICIQDKEQYCVWVKYIVTNCFSLNNSQR